MIELFIDGRAIDLSEGSAVKFSLSAQEITAPGEVKERVFPFTLPMNARNRAALGFPEQCASPVPFNRRQHTAKIVCIRCEANGDGAGVYHIALRVPPPAWLERAAQRTIAETSLACDHILNAATIRRSWSDERQAVKFLPVKWDESLDYEQEQTTLEALGYENYYPFVQVKAVLEAIAADAGYRIESKFLDEPFFRSLCMSGRYRQVEAMENVFRMDFAARRNAADRTVTASAEGRIFADNGTAPFVGNPVDTLDPTDAGENAHYGKSFRLIGGRPAFVPEADVVAGFEMRMKIRAPMKIASPTALQGLSKIVWDGESLHEFDLRNPLADAKNTGGKAGSYQVLTFNGLTGVKRITCYDTQGGSQLFPVFSDGSFTIQKAFVRATCEESNNGRYVPTDNWMLCDSAEYRALTEKLAGNHDLLLRSVPRLRKKNEPVFFDTLVFEVAPGCSLTLCAGTTIRPFFHAMPEAGAPLAFASVFDHRASQLDLIRAVAHLFGLHFYSDEAAKVVYIEPRFMFFDESREIDWSAKIDPGRPIGWSETGGERHRRETFCYRTGDAAVDRRSAGAKPYGAWTAHTTHNFARSGEKAVENPLFTASLDQRNALASAPDASMIVAGAKPDGEERVGVFDFPMKIVRYLGMTPLPERQVWGWPAEEPEYPLVMFHTAGVDWYTLCFDDEEGQLGLKNYHEPRYALEETGRKLSLYLRLTPSDVEAVRSPNSTFRDFRGRFVFRIRGERFRARLEAIHDYDPTERSTRCTFIVEH